MNRAPLNPSFYQTYNYATNTTGVDRGAMLRDELRREQMDRQDAAKPYTGTKAKVVYQYGKPEYGGYMSSSHREVVEVIEPKEAKIRTYGTQFSTATASMGGRTYVLPPVAKQDEIFDRPVDEQVLHFGGLGFNHAMARSIERNVDRVYDFNKEAMAQYNAAKKSRGVMSRLKGKPAPVRPETVASAAKIYSFYNERLAEARVPLKFTWHINEGAFMGYTVFLSPSSEGGNPQQSLEQWAAKEWAGKPYRPWTNEIIDLPDSWFQK